jgi:hypothetical protein
MVSFTRVTIIDELGTTLTVTSNRSTLRVLDASYVNVVPSSVSLSTLMTEVIRSSQKSVLTKAT